MFFTKTTDVSKRVLWATCLPAELLKLDQLEEVRQGIETTMPESTERFQIRYDSGKVIFLYEEKDQSESEVYQILRKITKILREYKIWLRPLTMQCRTALPVVSF